MAVDGSKESMAAVDKAIQMAARNESELIALTVLQLPVVHHYTPAVISAAIEKGVTEAEEGFGDVKRMAEESGAKIKTLMVESWLSSLRDSKLREKGRSRLDSDGD